MALPKELKFSATATNAPAAPMRSTRSKAWLDVQAVVAISAATRKVRGARIIVTPYFTANSITRHSFDNDSSIDIVGERLGLLRGTAAELARPGQSSHRRQPFRRPIPMPKADKKNRH